ncbi:EF-P 5-aminopentanol modification-associated protein YfmF [Tepidibacter formicigenes]|uniref:Predicted Zn-dependent peptidase n=1 Tax=Tepidibacter formicigenes DSM 15518 TaxID=1123349 RepID=A0A1M6KAW3_9FIRM|nr:pitrilysin family protein [Tepidibacter formicigenes]SHJ56052.1 Predicted Zn-dependent peptidase [Tepidibacter formicigenes DSM 15518]
MDNVERINLGNGINLTFIDTNKFKTNLVSVYIQRPLDKKEVTKNALIPIVLKNGSQNYKSQREISRKLDNLYGSSIFADVTKKGERQILSFKLLVTNDSYLDEDIFEEGLKFLNDIINNPLVEEDGFNKEYVEIEKNNLKDRIRSRINDKSKYALERCIEEMCKNEKFSINENGYEEDLNSIDKKNLYQHYKNIMKTSPIDIVVAGNLDKEKVIKNIKNIFKFERQKNIITIPREEIYNNPNTVKNILDKMDVTQGKIVLGFRTNIDFKEEKYYSLMVYSNILGGGPHSKLFMNVREKASLCYYVYSMVEKYKSIMFISSGIEIQNYYKALDLIKNEVSKMEKGEISQEEIENSKNSIINSIRSVSDSLNSLSDFYYSQGVSGSNETLDSIMKKIRKVTMDEIVDVSKSIKLDTIYFLRN